MLQTLIVLSPRRRTLTILLIQSRKIGDYMTVRVCRELLAQPEPADEFPFVPA